MLIRLREILRRRSDFSRPSKGYVSRQVRNVLAAASMEPEFTIKIDNEATAVKLTMKLTNLTPAQAKIVELLLIDEIKKLGYGSDLITDIPEEVTEPASDEDDEYYDHDSDEVPHSNPQPHHL